MAQTFVLIQHNCNPNYTKWLPKIFARMRKLGYRIINYTVDETQPFDGLNITSEGLDIQISSGSVNFQQVDRTLRRDFDNFFLRYLIPHLPIFEQKDLILLGEADLMLINPNTVWEPCYGVNVKNLVEEGKLVKTNQYPDGLPRACWTIGKVSAYRKLVPYKSSSELIKAVTDWQYSLGEIYKTDEEFVLHLAMKTNILYQLPNRFGDIDQMTCLRPNQVKYLSRWQDLIPFCDMHAIKADYMTQEDWNRLEILLEAYDEKGDEDILPPYYFMSTIEDKPRSSYLISQVVNEL